MNKLVKGVIFGGKARITLISVKDLVNDEIAIHRLSPIAAVALGRAMVFGAYLSANLKFDGATFSLTVNGSGPLGNIVVAGESGNKLRGFVANPSVDVSGDSHELSISDAVGKNGTITVIKDLGLKQPYVGKCEIQNGELNEDFSYYLSKSEGVNSVISSGGVFDKNGCVSFGGLVVEALPGLSEDMLFMLEDILLSFSNVAKTLAEAEPEDILKYHFGHLDSEIFEPEEVFLKCSCSEERMEKILSGLGKKELDAIIEEQGKIEIACQFCEKTYTYNKEETEELCRKYCLI